MSLVRFPVTPPKTPVEVLLRGFVVKIFLQIFSCSFVFPTKVLRGAHEKLDAEAMRVLNMSPDWTPGTKDCKPVPVSFTFPVNFEIPDSENK